MTHNGKIVICAPGCVCKGRPVHPFNCESAGFILRHRCAFARSLVFYGIVSPRSRSRHTYPSKTFAESPGAVDPKPWPHYAAKCILHTAARFGPCDMWRGSRHFRLLRHRRRRGAALSYQSGVFPTLTTCACSQHSHIHAPFFSSLFFVI